MLTIADQTEAFDVKLSQSGRLQGTPGNRNCASTTGSRRINLFVNRQRMKDVQPSIQLTRLYLQHNA